MTQNQLDRAIAAAKRAQGHIQKLFMEQVEADEIFGRIMRKSKRIPCYELFYGKKREREKDLADGWEPVIQNGIQVGQWGQLLYKRCRGRKRKC